MGNLNLLKERVSSRHRDPVSYYIDHVGDSSALGIYLDQFRGLNEFSIKTMVNRIAEGDGNLSQEELLVLMTDQIVKSRGIVMIKNILILNMTRMGDLVQSTSSIAGLRKQYPNACITLMVTSAFEEFSKKIPHINKRVIFDIKQFVDRVDKKQMLWVDVYKYLESFLNKLKDRKYDLLINLSHSKLSAFMILYLKIKNMRGFGCDENGDRITLDPWMQYFGIEPFNRQLNPFNLVEIFTRSAGVAP